MRFRACEPQRVNISQNSMTTRDLVGRLLSNSQSSVHIDKMLLGQKVEWELSWGLVKVKEIRVVENRAGILHIQIKFSFGNNGGKIGGFNFSPFCEVLIEWSYSFCINGSPVSIMDQFYDTFTKIDFVKLWNLIITLENIQSLRLWLHMFPTLFLMINCQRQIKIQVKSHFMGKWKDLWCSKFCSVCLYKYKSLW